MSSEIIIDAFDDFYMKQDIRAAIQFLLDAGYLAKSGSGGSRSWFVLTDRGQRWYARKWGKQKPRAEEVPPSDLLQQEA